MYSNIFTFLFSIFLLAKTEENLVVNISNGKLKGNAGTTLFSQKTFYQFRGIPYAKPPVGALRFRAPEESEGWTDVLDATDYRAVCPQLNYDTSEAEGDEDCLFVNVFTPKIKPEKPYPVVVLLHGGSYQFESGSSYSPDYLMEEEIVLVTFNHRINILGFLSTGKDGVIQGNAGLKDQVLLLKWVQKNIAHFGGDTEQVTLLGLNSGAVSVHLHMVSPMSDGLFHRAISQSGTAVAPWAIVRKPEVRVAKLAKLLECSQESSEATKECLLKHNASKIVEYQPAFAEWYIDPLVPVGPVIETPGDDPVFLSEFPYRLISEGKFKKNIPWLVGVNAQEGLLHATDIVNNAVLNMVINAEWTKAAPITLLYKHTTFDSDKTSTAIREYYFKDADINTETLDKLIQMYSDRYFFHPTHNAVKAHIQNGATAPIYPYYFDHIGDNSVIYLSNHPKNLEIKGVCHFDQAQYLFRVDNFPEINENQHEFAKKFVKIIAQFAQTGSPGESWSSVKPEDLQEGGQLRYNVIGSSDTTIPEPFTERIGFWDSLGLLELAKEMDDKFLDGLKSNLASKTEL